MCEESGFCGTAVVGASGTEREAKPDNSVAVVGSKEDHSTTDQSI